MTARDDELRHLLGLEAESRFEALARLEAPATAVAEGLAVTAPAESAPAAGLPPALLAALEAEPDGSAEARLDPWLGRARALRWDADPRVVLLEGLGRPVRAAGRAAEAFADCWAIDGRGAGGALCFFEGERRLVVRAAGGRVELLAVERAPAGRQGKPGCEDGEPTVPPPSPASLLAGLDAPDWLAEAAGELARSADGLDRLAAAGLAARLGAGLAREPRAALARLVAGEPSPGELAAAWARSLEPAALGALEARLAERAGRLGGELERLGQVVAEGGAAGVAATRRLCRERDLLESAAWTLERAGRGAAARAALGALDERAAVRLSTIDFAGELGDDLLAAVAWQEPLAWWGSLRRD